MPKTRPRGKIYFMRLPVTNVSKLLTLLICLFLCACSKGPGSKVDSNSLEQAFKSADAATKESVAKIAAQMKAKDNSAAFSDLLKLSARADLAPEQKLAVDRALHDVAQVIPPKAVMAPGMPAP